MLPFKHCTDENVLGLGKWCNQYIKIIERLEKNDNTKLKTFCVIFNGIANIFLKFGDYKGMYGLDGYICNLVSKEKEKWKVLSLSHICQRYILFQIAQTSISSENKSGIVSNLLFAKNKEKINETREKAISRLKQLLFKNEKSKRMAQFEKLMEYCVQDIETNKLMGKCLGR